MKIMLVDNESAGVRYVEVNEGSTVEDLFRTHLEGRSPNNYMIRVKSEQVSMGYTFHDDGDVKRVTVTPTNIEGA